MASHAAIIGAAIDAFNRRDFDTALEPMTEDATWAPFIARTETPLLRGREEIREAWRRQFEVLDLRIEAVEIVADDGEHTVARTHMVGRGEGSEISVDAHFAQVYAFEDDLIVAVESYESVDEALRAAGLAAP